MLVLGTLLQTLTRTITPTPSPTPTPYHDPNPDPSPDQGTLLQTPDAMLTMAAGLAAPSPLSRLPPARDGSAHPALLTRRR